MEPVVNRPTITFGGAHAVLAAAAKEAWALKVPVCIAVVDPAGTLVAFARLDDAPAMSIQIAQDKAYTVATFGLPTDQWYPMIADDPSMLHGIVKTDRLIVFGGGVPVVVDGRAVGAVGVSGGTCDEDVRIARAGAAALDGSDDDSESSPPAP